MSDAVSKMVTKVDGSRILELTLSDVIALCLPGTLLELLRPAEVRKDAVREAGFREFSGLICNIFLGGWLSYLAVQAIGSHVNRLNPKGVPGKAWMNANSLQALGDLYEQILKNESQPVSNLPEARKRLISQVLDGLVSADRELAGNALFQGVNLLPEHTQVKILTQLCKQHMPSEKLADVLKALDAAKQKPLAEQTKLLKEALQGHLGKLSPAARESLSRAFALNDAKGMNTALGTTPFDMRAEGLVGEAIQAEKSRLAELAQTQKRSLKDVVREFKNKEFIKTRLQLSMADLNGAEAAFIEQVKKQALEGGLTETVNLATPDGQVLLKGVGRDTFFKEVKSFLEQVVDRASHGIDSTHPDWKQSVLESIYGTPPKKTGFWRTLLPKTDDGLIPYLLKSKRLYTGVPIMASLGLAISMAFYNQWITQKKHGGKRFFPGEGLPTDGLANQKLTAPLMNSRGISFKQSATGAFAHFQSYRQASTGGRPV